MDKRQEVISELSDAFEASGNSGYTAKTVAAYLRSEEAIRQMTEYLHHSGQVSISVIFTSRMAPWKKKLVRRPFFNIISQYHTAVVEIIIVILVSESMKIKCFVSLWKSVKFWEKKGYGSVFIDANSQQMIVVYFQKSGHIFLERRINRVLI